MERFDGFEARGLQIDGQQIHFRCGGIRGAPGTAHGGQLS